MIRDHNNKSGSSAQTGSAQQNLKVSIYFKANAVDRDLSIYLRHRLNWLPFEETKMVHFGNLAKRK